MLALRLLLIALAALLLQILGGQFFPLFDDFVDLLLVTSIWFALLAPPVLGLVVAVALGWLSDWAGPELLGLQGVAGLVTAWVVILIRQRVLVWQTASIGMVFFLASWVQHAVVLAVGVLLLSDVAPTPWYAMLGRAVSTALLGVMLIRAQEAGLRQYDDWKRERSRQLRLD